MFISRRYAPAVALALAVLPAAAHAASPFALKNGDRVVMYGDSITEQRLYTTFVETYVTTRFPKLNVRFFDEGVGGDRVTGGWAGPIDIRLDRDVNAHKPTVMTCMLGMNDGSYRQFDDGIFNTYANGYRHIVDVVTKANPGLRVTLIQPSPFDDVTRAANFPGGYNAVLVAYSQFVKDLARSHGMNVADLNTPVVAVLARALPKDATLAPKIVPDRVHPGPGGHLIMAESILKSWNAPALVSEASIDASTARVVSAANTSIVGISGGARELKWTQTDRSLPFPLDAGDAALMLAVSCSDFVDALDQQPLKVTGLSSGNYALNIDGAKVGSFTADQLAAGINLATLDTPMARQAAQVHALVVKHNQLHRARWEKDRARWADMTAAQKAEFTAQGAEEMAALKDQIAAAQPQPHAFELKAE